MQLEPFRIEQYYGTYEFSARFMLSSSDAQTRSVGELLALEDGAAERLAELPLSYTQSPGAPELREAVRALYARLEPDDVLVASSAEEGIFLLYHALLGPGDHVIVETPCYESALQLARSTGADVSEWRRRPEDDWRHDVAALEALVRPNTRVLYVNTPHNPTGLLMAPEVYRAVLELARGANLVLFCDEVYRELEHDPSARLPAACDELATAVSLGSVSKTYGLPGLRLGWLASRDRELLRRVLELKYYTTICSPAPSEFLSALALRHRDTLADRNRAIVHRNLPQLEAFLGRHAERFSWVHPNASPIGFVRLRGVGGGSVGGGSVGGGSLDVDAFCREVVEATSVLLLPGSVYDEPEHVRVGYGRANMPEALERLETYLNARA